MSNATRGELHFLYHSASLGTDELGSAERIALDGDTLLHQLAARLLIEVRQLHRTIAGLEADLADPAYQYGTGRIHRHAIVTRNAEIARLNQQLKDAKEGKKE